MMDKKYQRRVFVIMPFSKTKSASEAQWTDIFNNVFKPAVESCDYVCERALPTTGSLVKSVIQDLVYSNIVIADITDRNANVFYELGVRHAVSKRTIMVTQNVSHVPSDLRGHWSLVYGIRPGEVAEFKGAISRLIREIDQDPEKNDSPVSEFLEQEATGIRHYVARDNAKKLSALFTELTAILNTLRESLSKPTYRQLIEFDCLNLLLNTLYVDVGVELLKSLHQLRHNLKVLRLGVRSDQELIQETIGYSATALDEIHALNTKLQSGQFSEPPQISTMVWSPLPKDSKGDPQEGVAPGQFSRSEDFSKIDIGALKRQFGKET